MKANSRYEFPLYESTEVVHIDERPRHVTGFWADIHVRFLASGTLIEKKVK
jgi:hypothetical protein